MHFPRISLGGALLALALMAGCDRQQQQSVPAAPPATGNAMSIHLQEGFRRGSEVTITIDGREVYRGTPKTKETLGFAAKLSATAATTRPVVALTVPAEGINWSQQIDLSAGRFLGISLTAGKQARIVQQTNGFGYE